MGHTFDYITWFWRRAYRSKALLPAPRYPQQMSSENSPSVASSKLKIPYFWTLLATHFLEKKTSFAFPSYACRLGIPHVGRFLAPFEVPSSKKMNLEPLLDPKARCWIVVVAESLQVCNLPLGAGKLNLSKTTWNHVLWGTQGPLDEFHPRVLGTCWGMLEIFGRWQRSFRLYKGLEIWRN